jgi:hypothetical protein
MNCLKLFFLICIGFCQALCSQEKQRVFTMADSVFCRDKLINFYKNSGSTFDLEIAEGLASNSHKYILQINEIYRGLSSRFEIYRFSTNTGHGDAGIHFVWDGMLGRFLDTVTISMFNTIVTATNRRLNNLEKLVLYNAIGLNINLPIYIVRTRVRKTFEGFPTGVSVKEHKLFEKRYKIQHPLAENQMFFEQNIKEINYSNPLTSLIDSSNDYVLYYPFFNIINRRSQYNSNSNKVTLQVVYFNAAGELVSVLWLFDFFTVDACKSCKRHW